MKNIKLNSLLAFIFLFFIYGNQNIFEWNSFTSLINPSSVIKDSNDDMVAATSGGLLLLSNNELHILKDNLNNLNLSIIGLDNYGLIWIGGASPNGNIQVLDNNYNLIYDSSYLGIKSVTEFIFSDNSVFVIYNNENDIGILEFNYDNGVPYYVDYYNSFPETITSISDIDLFNEYLYITTDQGIFNANIINDNLKLSTSWNNFLDNTGEFDSDILFFHRNDIGTYLITQQNLYLNQESILSFNSDPFDILSNDENSTFCNKSNCYKIDNSSHFLYSISEYNINNFYRYDNHLFFCIKNGGLMSLDLNNYNRDHYIPNTILQNRYDALTVMQDGSIAAISETNGFIYDGEKFKYFIPYQYSDLFPINLLSNYMNEGKNIFEILNYRRADKSILSIIENEFGNIMFNNSGITPNSNEINNLRGGVIEINPNNFNFIAYDTSKTDYMKNINYPIGVLDGLYGISDQTKYDSYMVVNQITKDNYGNVWCVTPYSEKYNHIASMQTYNNNENWKHIFSNDFLSYYPTEIAFDKYNRAWIAFNFKDTWNNSSIIDFSKGGIKVFSYSESIYNENYNSEDINWFEIDNLNDIPGGINSAVWSIDIGEIDNQEILWVLTSQGIQGYIIDGLELLPIYPLVYYSNLSFVEGDKIRVDSQNNAWIITKQDGVKIIKNDATLWPDGNGFLNSNSPLLSNVIYDIDFDDYNGLVYLSTESGISMINVPFSSDNKELDELYISPQPFLIPDDEYIEIKNLISGSNIKIMTINGNVIKEFDLAYNENIIRWDGRNDFNKLISTGIYYITSYKDNKSISKKIAIIRK